MCRKTFYVVSVVIDSAADKRYAAYQELSGALKRFEESVSTKANIPSGCRILWLKSWRFCCGFSALSNFAWDAINYVSLAQLFWTPGVLVRLLLTFPRRQEKVLRHGLSYVRVPLFLSVFRSPPLCAMVPWTSKARRKRWLEQGVTVPQAGVEADGIEQASQSEAGRAQRRSWCLYPMLVHTQSNFCSHTSFASADACHQASPHIGDQRLLACPVECAVTWALKEAEKKRPKTHLCECRCTSSRLRLIARIKLTHEKTANEPAKFMQIWRWEFANADPASILILWGVSWPGTIWGTCSYILWPSNPRELLSILVWVTQGLPHDCSAKREVYILVYCFWNSSPSLSASDFRSAFSWSEVAERPFQVFRHLCWLLQATLAEKNVHLGIRKGQRRRETPSAKGRKNPPCLCREQLANEFLYHWLLLIRALRHGVCKLQGSVLILPVWRCLRLRRHVWNHPKTVQQAAPRPVFILTWFFEWTQWCACISPISPQVLTESSDGDRSRPEIP